MKAQQTAVLQMSFMARQGLKVNRALNIDDDDREIFLGLSFAES